MTDDEFTSTCRLCGVLVGNRKLHDESHNFDPVRGAVHLLGTVETIEVSQQYGIEYADESADDEMYDTFEDAYEALQEHRVEQAKEKRRTGEDNFEGMRIVQRKVLTVKAGWSAFNQERA